MPSWYCPVWYSAFLFMGPVSLVLVLLRLQFGTWFVLFWALLLFLHVLFMISLEMHFCCSGSCSSITFLLMVVLVTPFNDFLLLLRFTAKFAVFFHTCPVQGPVWDWSQDCSYWCCRPAVGRRRGPAWGPRDQVHQGQVATGLIDG